MFGVFCYKLQILPETLKSESDLKVKVLQLEKCLINFKSFIFKTMREIFGSMKKHLETFKKVGEKRLSISC